MDDGEVRLPSGDIECLDSRAQPRGDRAAGALSLIDKGTGMQRGRSTHETPFP